MVFFRVHRGGPCSCTSSGKCSVSRVWIAFRHSNIATNNTVMADFSVTSRVSNIFLKEVIFVAKPDPVSCFFLVNPSSCRQCVFWKCSKYLNFDIVLYFFPKNTHKCDEVGLKAQLGLLTLFVCSCGSCAM